MSRRKLPVDIAATMRLPRDPKKTLRLDLAGLTWTRYGIADFHPDPAVLDLLDVARVVHEFDRRQPKRTTGVRPKHVRVSMPLRAPERWTAAVKAELGSILHVQGNADWQFDFERRQARMQVGHDFVAETSAAPRDRRPAISTVALFSGGLDSTCGLATLADQAERTLLVSYYGQNRTKQTGIAAKLGFDRLVQVSSRWSRPDSARRVGGQFMYRSFLFLALATVFAHSARAQSLLQFENGPLALAVEPLELYRITRHAHPLVHRHLEKLIKLLTGRAIAVGNPFIGMTKGEAVAQLRTHLSKKDFRDVIALTETCWYLNSKTIVAGPARKENNEPCGACVPCLVRRAALSTDDTHAATDFRNGRGKLESDPVVRVHYEAYAAFARRLLDKNCDVYDFLEQAPRSTRIALAASTISAEEAFRLYRRFAKEWMRVFHESGGR